MAGGWRLPASGNHRRLSWPGASRKSTQSHHVRRTRFWRRTGCTVSRDIVLRDASGRQAVCEGVTGLYGLRSHTLLSVQRRCVEDFQRAGYERVPEQTLKKTP